MMKPLMLEHTALTIGAEKPFKLLHVSDTHISMADERDDARKQQLAVDRARAFEGDQPGSCLEHYRYSCELARKEQALLVHTGDLFDFVSEKHLDMAPQLLAMPDDLFYAAGNHEYSLYVGEAFEDEKYKALSFDRVQQAFGPHDLRFASRVVNGVNLIAIDNVYYDFSQYALDRLKEEAAKGLPMLLFFHTPLYTPALYHLSMTECHMDHCALLGVPIEKMQTYNDYRFRQQVCTPQTRKFLDYLYGLDLVKAIFAGHLHISHQSPLENGVMQYVVGTQAENMARLIVVE